jgi:2-methylcitrate dehydratase PrpD
VCSKQTRRRLIWAQPKKIFPPLPISALLSVKERQSVSSTNFIKKYEEVLMSVSPELKAITDLAVNTRWEDIPELAYHDLKRLILDSIGCAFAGISVDPGKMFITLGKQLGGTPESSIIGTGDKTSCVNAAMVNGQLINAIDYDALLPGAHTPPYILAPTLAVGEKEKISGRDFLLATALGLEINGRVAGAVGGGTKFIGEEKNLQWSARWGQAASNFGVAAGVGKILKLNHTQMMHAMGTAGHFCQAQTWIRYTFTDHRPMAKYGVPGWQNTGGVIAALLAQMGYMGDPTIFDAKEGFWKYIGYESWNPDSITNEISKTWIFNKITYKCYPCCRMFQTELDCFLKILADNKLSPDEIESVRVFGHPTLDTPAFTNRELTNISDIQFGPAYIFSMAANGIPRGVEWQDMEIARSSKITNFARKVTYMGAKDFGKKQISRAEVAARNNLYIEEKPFADVTKPTEKDLLEKYRHNASRILTEAQIDNSINMIMEIDKVKDISALIPLITM